MFSLTNVSSKRIACCIAVAGFMALGSQALVAGATENDGLSTLQGLLAENKNLTVQLRKVRKVKGEIDRKDSEIQGAASALKHAQDDLRRRGARMEEENRRIDEEATRSGCPWGTKSTDLAYVNSCNALGAKLMGWKEDLKKQGDHPGGICGQASGRTESFEPSHAEVGGEEKRKQCRLGGAFSLLLRLAASLQCLCVPVRNLRTAQAHRSGRATM